MLKLRWRGSKRRAGPGIPCSCSALHFPLCICWITWPNKTFALSFRPAHARSKPGVTRAAIVFANAGAGSPLPLGKITAEHIDETFDTNVKGTIFTVQKALPLMRSEEHTSQLHSLRHLVCRLL